MHLHHRRRRRKCIRIHSRAFIYFRPTTAFHLYSEEVVAVRREEIPSTETRLRIVFKNPSHPHPGVSLAKRGQTVHPLPTLCLVTDVACVLSRTRGSFCATAPPLGGIFDNNNKRRKTRRNYDLYLQRVNGIVAPFCGFVRRKSSQ